MPEILWEVDDSPLVPVNVWPGLDAAGVSLVVYREDGVTLIPPSGTSVDYVDYYAALLAKGWLLTYDPLA